MKSLRPFTRRWTWAMITALILVAVVIALLVQVDVGTITGTTGRATPTSLATPDPDVSGPSPEVVNNPVMFIENVGQFDGAARFQVLGANAIWLTDDALWVTVTEQSDIETKDVSDPSASPTSAPQQGVNLKLSFPGANPHSHLEPFDRLDIHISYFVGNDPAGWYVDVPVWGGVRYKDIYPGVDLELTGGSGRWQQRLVAQSDANLDAVRMRVEGAEEVAVEGDRLRLSTAEGDFTLPLLIAEKTGNPTVTSGNDVLNPFVSLASQLTPSQTDQQAAYDASSDLLYGTYLVGDNRDWGYSIAVDNAGSAYVTGVTSSADFPTTPGAVDTTGNSGSRDDVFVAKLNPAGSALEYATFLGGNHNDWGYGIAVDGEGNAYITGGTSSSDFPSTSGAFDVTCGTDGSCDPDFYSIPNDDAFVVKLNSTGTALEYATFLGGASSENGAGIVADGSGSAHVVGSTRSEEFPSTPGAFDTVHNGLYDAFVVKLNPTGSALEYATFLGGSGDETGEDIALYGEGNVYITGGTFSGDFPTTQGAFNTIHSGPYGAFVVKLNPTGSALEYATFLGGNGSDYGYAVAVDGAGSAYVAGDASSDSFPVTPGAFDTTYDNGDVFVAKLNPQGIALTYATFLGGSESDRGRAITVDGVSNVYVVGDTESFDFPVTLDAFDSSFGGGTSLSRGDAFFAKLDPSGSLLIYASFLGGSGGDHGRSIVVDGVSNAYVTGYTNSADFPTTPGAFDTVHNDCTTCDDGFVVKLSSPGSAAVDYSISGWVSDSHGKPLSDVTIFDDAGHTATTGSDGHYVLDGLAPGVYTVEIFKSDQIIPSTSREIRVPPDATEQNFTLLPDSVSVTLAPDSTTTLIYTDTQGLLTTLEFPAGAVGQTTTLFLTPTLTTGGSGFAFAGHAFDLAVFQEGILQHGFTFGAPVTVTIHYSNADVRVISDENQLALRWWTGSGWADATATCAPPTNYAPHPDENWLAVAICSPNQFALFGPTQQVYMPLVMRNR